MLTKIALALDIADEENISKLLSLLEPKPHIIKIGLELISALGIQKALNLTQSLSPQSEIFLDFKLHDIPNTVTKAIKPLLQHKQIKYLTVHTLGGHKMLTEALKAVEGQINLVGVTVLTSHSEQEIKTDLNLELNSLSQNLVKNAHLAGLNWLVSSVWECLAIKQKYNNFKIITPGIRFSGQNKADQARIASPTTALEQGSDIMVIGRAVCEAENPQMAWQSLLKI